VFDGFTKRYGLKRLVYFEIFDSIATAIQHEKTMKHWPRAWKGRLMLATNPNLYHTLIRHLWLRLKKTWMAVTSTAMTSEGLRPAVPQARR